ncbi:hypothetical protein CSB62_09815 [Vibrio splendidus]|uniref:Uncharacterized protein n=1 Tax=Vibrio lentus TaxID=136468 RepID=A0A4U2F6I3_9VIBR|nr:hypothetical protein [Vibrio lentus]PHN86210.1 hypothetical protein CSB62_09815 [Vibrio splendidus]MCC4781370.1 hypothetical protein [Vibrio lentus]MCC4856114.1 hypothetical protein [Vibrio lentus]PMJ06387.1 hypothetical protein BCU31_04800 [Vibrio lentus]PML11419.1 hypothetical protein BCT85_00880 [Vibrio lentus]
MEHYFFSAYPNQIKHKISEQEFLTYKQCVETLYKIYQFEELHDQVVQSYTDYKTHLYHACIQFSGMGIIPKQMGYEWRLKANRLLLTTLNLSKLYLDKCYQHKADTSFVGKLTGQDKNHEIFKIFRKKLFESNDGYAVGDELRNYVQHQAMLIDVFTYGFHQKTIILYSCVDQTKLLTFIKSRGPSKTKLERLQAVIEANCYKDKGLDLHRILDQFVTGVGELHRLNRSTYRDLVYESSNCLERNLLSQFPESQDKAIYEGNKRVLLNHKYLVEIIEYIMEKNSHTIDHSAFDASTYPPL